MWIVARPAVEPISLAPGAKNKYPFHLEVAGCADALAAKAKNIPKKEIRIHSWANLPATYIAFRTRGGRTNRIMKFFDQKP